MAYLASFNSRLYVGSLAWAVYSRGFSFNDTVEMLDITCLPDTSKKFTPGLESATVSHDMLLDTATSGNFATLNTWKGTPQVETLLWAGTARGTECLMVQANQSSFTVTSPVADVVQATGEVQCDTGIDFGVVLDPESAVTTTATTTAVDNGAATANGGVAHVHVTAFSGLTSNTITIEHSTDNSAFSTLGTFTAVTGTTSQRLVIAAGTTVNRYVRVKDTVVGVGSTSRIVTFARR